MKKSVWVVVLLVIIVLAVVWAIRSAGRGGVPNWVLGEMVKKTDTQTQKTITLPLGEWEKLTSKQLLATAYKEPKTGKYTVVDFINCIGCGKEIPGALITDEDIAKGGRNAALKLTADYKCPYCGKCPYPFAGTSGGTLPHPNPPASPPAVGKEHPPTAFPS